MSDFKRKIMAMLKRIKDRQLNKNNLGSGVDKHYGLDTSPSQELQTELKSTDKYKMQDFIEQKKNRTPFYKDDNKKTWE